MKEPTAIGTIVRDSYGQQYVRVESELFPWLSYAGTWHTWNTIDFHSVIYSERESFVKWLRHLADNATGKTNEVFLNNLALRAKRGEQTMYGGYSV